jgi:hypothetical protein
MLKGKKIMEYPKTFKGGILGFVGVYEVSGTEQEIQDYVLTQTERDPHDPETGKVLFWSPNGSGDNSIEITLTRAGKAVEINEQKNEEQKLFIKLRSLGQEVFEAGAQAYAQNAVAELFTKKRTRPVFQAPVSQAPVNQPPVTAPTKEAVIGEMGEQTDK